MTADAARRHGALQRSAWSRLSVKGEKENLTHYLFRYPAKFHPPVARTLLQTYTDEGDLVLDPFCGSGTLLVEASVLGRPSIGIDIDPVAVAVAQAKVHRYQIGHLRQSADRLLDALACRRRSPAEYERRMFTDLTPKQYEHDVARLRLRLPPLPNLLHWFRRYVVVDLALIRSTIERAAVPDTHKHFFRVVFASIIRNSSNADPVPVSGLEVTAHMKRRDKAGRLVDPFSNFKRALRRSLDATELFNAKARRDAPATLLQADAIDLDGRLPRAVDAVITSPPYHGAVEYYRRHTLEMFWLGCTNSTEERLALLDDYVGRPKVPARHPYVAKSTLDTALARHWETKIRRSSEERANAFKHYVVAMSRFFSSLSDCVKPAAPVIVVVGHNTWNNARIPTTDLFAEVTGKHFTLQEVVWYPVMNRYMSYSRHNKANIDKEYVLLFRRSTKRSRQKRRAGRTA